MACLANYVTCKMSCEQLEKATEWTKIKSKPKKLRSKSSFGSEFAFASSSTVVKKQSLYKTEKHQLQNQTVRKC